MALPWLPSRDRSEFAPHSEIAPGVPAGSYRNYVGDNGNCSSLDGPFAKYALRSGCPMANRTAFGYRHLALAALLLPSVGKAEPAPNNATVSVSVGPLRNGKGSLSCRLYTSGAGFPRNLAGTTTQRVKIAGGSARCVFENVAPGTYAVVVLHDENDNRQCDRNRLGIPLEGYGVSNNRTYALSAPNWQESKFSVEAGKDRALSISLRY